LKPKYIFKMLFGKHLINIRLQPGEWKINGEKNRLNGFHFYARKFTALKRGVNEVGFSN